LFCTRLWPFGWPFPCTHTSDSNNAVEPAERLACRDYLRLCMPSLSVASAASAECLTLLVLSVCSPWRTTWEDHLPFSSQELHKSFLSMNPNDFLPWMFFSPLVWIIHRPPCQQPPQGRFLQHKVQSLQWNLLFRLLSLTGILSRNIHCSWVFHDTLPFSKYAALHRDGRSKCLKSWAHKIKPICMAKANEHVFFWMLGERTTTLEKVMSGKITCSYRSTCTIRPSLSSMDGGL